MIAQGILNCRTDLKDGGDEDSVGVRETEEGSAAGVLELADSPDHGRVLAKY